MKLFATQPCLLILAVFVGSTSKVQGQQPNPACSQAAFACQESLCNIAEQTYRVCGTIGSADNDPISSTCLTLAAMALDADDCLQYKCGGVSTVNGAMVCVSSVPAFTPASTPAPTPAPTPDGCFSATSEVEVEGMGSVAMENVQIGDQVLVDGSSNKYEEIYAMGHSSKDQVAEFLKIDVSTGQSLELTGEHLVFLAGKDTPVRASAVKVGDSLETIEAQTAVVKKITTVKKKGLYTPLTPSGKVVVNDIQASSYIALQDDSEDTITIAGSEFSHQGFVHFALSPMRVVCMGINDTPCKVVSSNGIPLYIELGMTVVRMVSEGSVLAFAFFAAVGIPLLAAFNTAEAFFGPTFAALGCFALFAAHKVINVSKKQIKQA